MNKDYTIEVLPMQDCLSNPTVMGYLRGMTLHPDSGMNIMLDEFRDVGPSQAQTIVAYFDKEPVAWALIADPTGAEAEIDFDIPGDVYVQLYVKPEYRKHGIGSSLFLKVQELVAGKKISVSRHSDEATSFFDKVLGVEKEESKEYHFTIMKSKAIN